jgi:hypothetical protein
VTARNIPRAGNDGPVYDDSINHPWAGIDLPLHRNVGGVYCTLFIGVHGYAAGSFSLRTANN